MTRVLLINPPSPEQLGAPLLGLQYVAAALLQKGCEVRVIDAASRYGDRDPGTIVRTARAFGPDLIGFSLFTRWVWHAYQLAAELAGSCRLLVAGGAHVTARPAEVLEHGFDVAVIGEAEVTLPALVDYLEGSRSLDSIPGIQFRGGEGPAAVSNNDLDALAMPFLAQDLFDSRWYNPSGLSVIPGGMLASRGCPARCTFCANYVTGRKFRFRSPANVVAELNTWHARYGNVFFPFWDDALTADPRHLERLCKAFEHLDFPMRWSAITRANMVTPELLRLMNQAGCVAVNFGVESGDNAILRVIKKGLTTEQVVRALGWAKDEGLTTAANFMLGFPEETPEALGRTLAFMERIAPLVDSFSTLGVAVPFPGTPLYEDNHSGYGFTDWWLREDHSWYTPAPPTSDFDRFYRHYIDDRNLELDFFHYTDAVRGQIRECLKFKAEHNLRRMGLLRDPVFAPDRQSA
jgi:anaerobic magnesium-protoporphyrin IX monomethyl ester cyclase